MKISDLEKKLKSLRETMGDISVVSSYDPDYKEAPTVKVLQEKKLNGIKVLIVS